MSGENIFKLTHRRVACTNSRFEVCLDSLEEPGGTRVDDFLVVRPRVHTSENVAGVLVLPESGGRIGLMHGHRHHLDAFVWQAPAGFIDDGETSTDSALRELAEETGLACRAENLLPLGTMLPDAGLIQARVALFTARDVWPIGAEDGRGSVEPGMGNLVWFSPDDFFALLAGEHNIGGTTLVAGFRYLAHFSSEETPAPAKRW